MAKRVTEIKAETQKKMENVDAMLTAASVPAPIQQNRMTESGRAYEVLKNGLKRYLDTGEVFR